MKEAPIRDFFGPFGIAKHVTGESDDLFPYGIRSCSRVKDFNSYATNRARFRDGECG